eukprot:scaffold641_cov237-Pinguiococcus_pyrenoidosus.AAC.3
MAPASTTTYFGASAEAPDILALRVALAPFGHCRAPKFLESADQRVSDAPLRRPPGLGLRRFFAICHPSRPSVRPSASLLGFSRQNFLKTAVISRQKLW